MVCGWNPEPTAASVVTQRQASHKVKEPREQKPTGDSGAVGIQAGFRRRGH